jgi:DNA-directed RNA polymerase subunit RPC12/RpoP
MSLFKHFDVEAELQKLRGTPANPANPANPAPRVSDFSTFSRGAAGKGQGPNPPAATLRAAENDLPPPAEGVLEVTPATPQALQQPCSFCGVAEGSWLFNRGTCWAQWICRQCQRKVTTPIAHLCDPALPLTAPCQGQEPQPLPGEFWTCSGCGRSVPLTEETERGSRHYVCPTCSSFILVPQEPGKLYTSAADESLPPGRRDFLPRPLGQEDAEDVWAARAPLKGGSTSGRAPNYSHSSIHIDN